MPVRLPKGQSACLKACQSVLPVCQSCVPHLKKKYKIEGHAHKADAELHEVAADAAPVVRVPAIQDQLLGGVPAGKPTRARGVALSPPELSSIYRLISPSACLPAYDSSIS